MDEQLIQIKDKEAELANLRVEIIEKVKELSLLHIQINAELENISQKRKELKDENDRIESEKAQLIKLYGQSTVELIELKGEKEKVRKEILVSQSRNRAIIKDLGWVNDKVLKARIELVEVERLKDEVHKKKLALVLFTEMVPDMQSIVLKLESRRDSIRSEISSMLDDSSLELVKSKEQLVLITKEVENKIKEAAQAEYNCKKYVDELYSHMNDYTIIKSRLESVYKTKFPELDLKI